MHSFVHAFIHLLFTHAFISESKCVCYHVKFVYLEIVATDARTIN